LQRDDACKNPGVCDFLSPVCRVMEHAQSSQFSLKAIQFEVL